VTTPAAGDTAAPSVPQNLHQTAVTGSSVSLAWDASTDDTAVAAYIVSRNGVDLPAIAGTTLVDSPLASGVTYTYTVRARDASNNTSAPSSQLQVTTPDVVAPSAPGNLTAPSVSASSVQLSWNGSTDNVGVVAYDVRRNGNIIGSPTTPGFTDNTVVAGQTYSYTVTARDAAGNAALSSPLSVTAVDADPTLFSDLFGGANGSAWGSDWTTNATSATATQQSGTGQLAITDVAGAFGRAQLTGVAARADSDTTLSYRFNATSAVAYLNVWARGSGGWQNAYRPRSGYGLEMRPQSGTIEVIENNNGTTTTLATITGARQVNTAKQWLRLRVVGSTIQFKSWADGQAEPAAWRSTITDTTVTAAGQLHLSFVRGGSNVGAKNVQIDDLSVLPG
jgi:chitodextrinase